MIVFADERFDSRIVRRCFLAEMHDVIYIVPEAVIKLNMAFKPAKLLLLELKAQLVADITVIRFVEVHSSFLFSEICKGINDNTKENVQENNLDQDMEGSILSQLDCILLWLVLVMDRFSIVADATIETDSFVHSHDETLKNVHTSILTNPIRIIRIDGEVPVSILQVEKGNGRKDVHSYGHQEPSHQQLYCIHSHTFNHIL